MRFLYSLSDEDKFYLMLSLFLYLTVILFFCRKGIYAELKKMGLIGDAEQTTIIARKVICRSREFYRRARRQTRTEYSREIPGTPNFLNPTRITQVEKLS